MAQDKKSEAIMVRVSSRGKKAFEDATEELDMKVTEFLRSAALLYLSINHGHSTTCPIPASGR